MQAQLGFCQGNSGDPIFTETFGSGTIYGPQLPAGTTTYNFVGNGGPQDGEYTVGTNTFFYGWNLPSDHTGDSNGKCLIVNANSIAEEFYKTSVNGLCENTTYEFSSWLINILPASGCGGNGVPVNVQFEIRDITDTSLLATGNTGNIFGSATPTWLQYGLVFQTLPGQTSVILKMINNAPSSNPCGNDLAIDDIVFKSCGDLIAVEDSNANDLVTICSAETPYSNTITAVPDNTVFSSHFYQWQESTDGINWVDIAGETNASISVSGVTTTRYYRSKVAEYAANLSNSDCLTFSDVYQISVISGPDVPISDGDVGINCVSNDATLSVTVPNGVSVNWFDTAVDGTLLQANSETYTTTTDGTYYAEAVDDSTGCVSQTRVAINASAATLPNAPVSNGDVNLDCITNEATLSVTVPNGINVDWFDAAVGSTLLESNSETLVVNAIGNYYAQATNPVTGCVSAIRVAVNVDVITNDDASFDITPTCEGATVNITGTLGGNFVFNPIPTDSAIIDSATGNVTNGTTGETYTIEYTTSGGCSTTNEQSFSVLLLDDASFEIMPTCDGGIATITGLTGGTFVLNPDPMDGAVINVSTGEISNGIPDTTYTVEYTTNGDCTATSNEIITVNSGVIIINPTALQVCDDGTADGLTEIDLSIKNTEITANNPLYSVSYYESLAEAENSSNPLPISYTNTSNGQIIFVRVENINTGCYDVTFLELSVQQAPVANEPTDLEYCDSDSDGFGVFDLTIKDDEITGNDPTLTVSYHETIENAENSVDAIASPYNNIVIDAQTIYARVESSSIATDCETIVTLQLVVNPTPQLGATPPTVLQICDDLSADGFGQFDLTSKNAEILLNLADPSLYSVTFYLDEANAEDAINPINNATNFTNNVAFAQLLWVRVEDIATGCYKLTTLELIVNALPVLVQPDELTLCDDNNPGDEIEEFTLDDASDVILNGQTGIGLTYFETLADANSNTNPIFSPYTNTSNPQTIFVKATNNSTGCENMVTLTVRVNPIPSPLTPTDLEACDEENDGFTSFNLESKSTEIIGGELDIAITYHETLEDANTGNNAMASPYTNIVINQQTLYVRAINTVSGCYNASRTLIIRVLETPEIPINIEGYFICDTDSNGFAQFNLSTKTSEIIGTQTDMSISYHVFEADALTGNNPISNPNSFTNTSNPQTIYVRLENDTNLCFDTGFFEISVELPPEAIQPTPLRLCDDEIADEITVFDLTVKNDEITGNNPSWSVDYYETLANAQAETDAVNAEAYTNTAIGLAEANPQTLFAVVTDTDTGCTDMVTLTIRVLPNPTPTQLLPDLVLCDDTNTGDMIEEFDLTEDQELMFNDESNVFATYFETYEDAEDNVNAIADATQYTNTSTPQIIYTRVENNITGCFTIVNFTLIVNPLPTVVAVTDFIQCELNSVGFDSFNLETKTEEILNGQDASEYIVTYHITQQDADDVMNALVSPYINVTNPQQIFVAITNIETGCSISTPSFNIEVHEGAWANPDTMVFQECDDNMENDGDTTNNSTQFDLTTQDPQILDGQDPVNYIVTYFETEEDANLNVNPLPTLYENTVNPQVIYARVDNDTPDGAGADSSICYAVTALTLQVNPLPEFDFEESYILCVNTNGSEVLEPLVIDTELSTAGYSFVWFLNTTTELLGETNSSLMPTEGGIYKVVVTNLITGCENEDETIVIESEPPATITIERLTQAFAENHVLLATAQGDGEYEYSLDDGPWQDDGLFTNVSAGQHKIIARDKNGCGSEFSTEFIVDYPKYFTPNDDGYNDTWNIAGIGDNAKIYIFDRYGKLLKQISPSGNGWNGTYNGNNMPTDGYWFLVEYDEPDTAIRKEFKAHFTLKR